MIPRTLSASSLQVASLCLDRWNAEYMHRTPNFSNAAADVGTSVHGALEQYVKAVYIDKTHAELDKIKRKELLITFYQMSYVQTFATADMDTAEYRDGFALAMKWFERTDLESMEVMSVEEKRGFEVPFNHPDGPAHSCEVCAAKQTPGVCYVPFNFVMDRLDKVGENRYRVVDYKTIRIPINPEELENKIQARAYALAVQIMFPETEEVVVQFDLLRHEAVTVYIKREENIAFWRFLCAELQRLVNTPEEDIIPTLNPECRFCVKKFSCELMTKNITAGGIMSLDVDGAAKLLEALTNQMAANRSLIEGLEEIIMKHAADIDQLEWDSMDGEFEIGVGLTSGRRSVNGQRAAEIMGPQLFGQLGSITVAKVEDLIKDTTLPQEMREQLKTTMSKSNGNLKAFAKRKKKI